MSSLRTMILGLAALSFSVGAIAAEPVKIAEQTPPAPEEGKVIRVGGDYLVTAVDHTSESAHGGFRVEFKALTPSGKFDILHLDSDHVHVAVKVGQTLRLSAEILSQKGNAAEVAQMVIFVPNNAAGRTPVWMLSNKAPNLDLRATKYLEMHDPATDYVVM